MKKFGKLELCLCLKGDKYDGLRKVLERCVSVDEDYARLLAVLFLEQGDNPNCTCNDVEDDPHYMNFLANTKLDGTSYVSKVNDQNGLPVFIKYEKDRELEIHGVEKGQDNVREKYELGRSSKALKTNARKDRELESHGVEKGHDNVREKYKLGWSSKALKTNARKNRMEDGILIKKRGNEDRDLDNRKQIIDVEIVPGKEQKMKDGILSKKRRNEDWDLDKRKPKHQIDVNIVPGKEQQMKDNILNKRPGNEDRDLGNRNHRIDVKIVHGTKPKMNDGILSKKRGNEDRDLDDWKHIIDVNNIPGKEQRIQNDSKLMDAEVKIEPKEDSDSLKEAISQSEVEILENVGAELGRGSSSNPFVPSVEHCLNLDATIIDSRYRKEVLNLLMRPYNEEEYKKLWKDIKMQLPSSSTNGRGKSFLSQHKAVNRAIKRTNHDKDKKLNIMRGFFFWLEHLTRQDAFQPWEDAECLQMMPGSS
ncbi:uncharacterized protein LOC129904414 isoform X3 [Solanum dulcamara]|uniref:uncharacterized protein LOC129904414 isoform X3 n=1 Tax=Solanum dulcamara TaxID=45834 RepID=UPI002486A19E|nr:uncharacterized protein LOC129904414 isoform X3 [Solanum dulcamara]